MASQDKCRDLIQRFNSQLQSPRSDISASEGAAAAAPRQQIPHAGDGEDFGAPALDEPGTGVRLCTHKGVKNVH